MQHSSPRRNVRLAVGGFLGVAPEVDLQPMKNQTDLPMPAFVSFQIKCLLQVLNCKTKKDTHPPIQCDGNKTDRVG